MLANHLTFHSGSVTQHDRQKALGQTALTFWLTGLSAAGKSTLAFAVERLLHDKGRTCYVLDGDNVRHGLNKDLGFSSQDRTENIRRVAEVSRLMNDAGLIVVTAFISPLRQDRDAARRVIGESAFREIYVNPGISVCEQRDPKGLYKKARSGDLPEFTGVSAPYEAPLAPDWEIDTGVETVVKSAQRLVDYVLMHVSSS